MRAHETTDLIRVIVNDHREVQKLFTELETGNSGPQHRKAAPYAAPPHGPG